MLTKTAPDQVKVYAASKALRKSGSLLTRKIWLPRLVYDCLPYFYLIAGFAAFFATLYISEWFWVLPHYLLFSVACVHLAFAVSKLRRRRRTQAGDPENKPGH